MLYVNVLWTVLVVPGGGRDGVGSEGVVDGGRDSVGLSHH